MLSGLGAQSCRHFIFFDEQTASLRPRTQRLQSCPIPLFSGEKKARTTMDGSRLVRGSNRRWTETETILALELYCQLPFGRCSQHTPEVISLAKRLARTPSSIAMKLVNFASFDPEHRARGVRGLAHSSRLDHAVWEAAHGDWEGFAQRCARLTDDLGIDPPVKARSSRIELAGRPPSSTSRHAQIEQRIGQDFFRGMVLAGYGARCCVTSLSIVELLVASHIVPWAANPHARLNPMNGVCLSALYDRAFDRHLMTITPDYRIRFSKLLLTMSESENWNHFFTPYEGTVIHLPERWAPDTGFLEQHNQEFSRKSEGVSKT